MGLTCEKDIVRTQCLMVLTMEGSTMPSVEVRRIIHLPISPKTQQGRRSKKQEHHVYQGTWTRTGTSRSEGQWISWMMILSTRRRPTSASPQRSRPCTSNKATMKEETARSISQYRAKLSWETVLTVELFWRQVWDNADGGWRNESQVLHQITPWQELSFEYDCFCACIKP